MQPFVERGIRIVGLDISARMREKAAARLARYDGGCYEIVSGDMSDFALPERVAYAICAFSTYSKLLSVEQQASFFRSVHAQLLPGGRFVLDMFVQTPDFQAIPDGVLIEDYRDRWFEQQGCRVSRSKRLHKDVAASVNQIDLVYDFHVNGSPTPAATRVLRDYTRYSTRGELDAHFRDQGFIVEHVFAGYDGSTFGPDSHKMIFVARRAS
jgi:SAM-dependent methyltransferase